MLSVHGKPGHNHVKAYIPHAKRGISVIGGSLANFAITLLRNKLLAIYVGPVGVGLIALVNNLNETGAVASGTGICDAYNRELARKRANFTAKQIVSSGIGIFVLLLTLVLPAVIGLYFYVVRSISDIFMPIIGLTIAGTAAGIWRLLSGVYLGFGLSRRMFNTVVIGAVVNLIVAWLLLLAGIREPIVFVATTPVFLTALGLFGLRDRIKGLIDWQAICHMPARKPIMTIALPIVLGLLMEPMTAFYLRSVTTDRFGEVAVGIIQPGLQFGMLASSLWNSFLGMTIVRWDQTSETAFSRKFVFLLSASLALPLVGTAIAFGMKPLWPALVSMLFTDEFLPGVITIPWFLAGEACRMGGIMLNHTFLSRGFGMLTLIPRFSCLGVVITALHSGFDISLLAIAQAYAMAYFSYFALTVTLWLWLQVRMSRVAG